MKKILTFMFAVCALTCALMMSASARSAVSETVTFDDLTQNSDGTYSLERTGNPSGVWYAGITNPINQSGSAATQNTAWSIVSEDSNKVLKLMQDKIGIEGRGWFPNPGISGKITYKTKLKIDAKTAFNSNFFTKISSFYFILAIN